MCGETTVGIEPPLDPFRSILSNSSFTLYMPSSAPSTLLTTIQGLGFKSRNLTVQSSDPDASSFESCEKATELTQSR